MGEYVLVICQGAMANAEQIRDLVASFARRDDERFRTVAMNIAASAAKAGDSDLASAIQELVDRSRRTVLPAGAVKAVPITRPDGELSTLVTASYPRVHLSDMVLAPELRARLERVLTENRQADHLRSHGLDARRKLLLVGPPGCGKTMTAQALAGEARLPLLVIQFHTLITRYMGETAAKLHTVFQSMQKNRGVYLFDEFDALGTSRLVGNDVGEARRIVNSFLQLLEGDESASIIVAATNHVEALDHALFRRFDDILSFSIPTSQMIRELVANKLHVFAADRLNWKRVLASARGFSHADIAKACEDSAKDAILAGHASVTTSGLMASLQRRRSQDNRASRKRK